MLQVLIVDDEEKVCTLIQYLVDWEKMGLQVVGVANDGVTAMGLIEEKQPDIVITDIQMPGYNGLEVIQQVREKFPEIHFVIISGYRQFDYAHQAIKFGVENYLLKPIKQEELIGTLEKLVHLKKSEDEIRTEQELLKKKFYLNRKKIKQNLLFDILNSNGEVLDKACYQINGEYDCNFQEGIFQGIVVKADCSAQLETEKAYEILNNKMKEILEKEFSKESYELLTYIGEEGVYLLYNVSEEDKELRWKIKHIRNDISGLRDIFPEILVTVGVGKCVYDIRELPNTVFGARNAVLNRLIVGAGKTIEEKQTGEKPLELLQVMDSKFHAKFLDYMEVYHLEGIQQMLQKIEKTLIEKEAADGKLVLQGVNEILDIFFLSVKKLELEVDIAEKKVEFRKIFHCCLKVNEVFDKLFTFMEEIMKAAIADKKNVETEPILEAKKYIQEHYNHTFKFEEIAEKVGFNYAYFSTLFKKETGQTLTEYALQIRIQKAKQLLLNPGISIMEVAEEVGYTDLKYFAKQFKKVTNLSPKEYRKLFVQK